MEELVKFKQRPAVPEKWNYDTSVAKVKQCIYKWKNLTEEIAKELWVARQILSAQGRRVDLERNKED